MISPAGERETAKERKRERKRNTNIRRHQQNRRRAMGNRGKLVLPPLFVPSALCLRVFVFKSRILVFHRFRVFALSRFRALNPVRKPGGSNRQPRQPRPERRRGRNGYPGSGAAS